MLNDLLIYAALAVLLYALPAIDLWLMRLESRLRNAVPVALPERPPGRGTLVRVASDSDRVRYEWLLDFSI